MTKEETKKPSLAPKTIYYKTAKSRERMTSEEHGNVLHLRSAVKQEKLKKLKAENLDKEVEECTFAPVTNTYKKNPRLFIEERNSRTTFSSAMSQSPSARTSKMHKSPRQQKSYVTQHLYKPRLRSDREKNEIEYEKSKKECTFKPIFYSKQQSRNESRSPSEGDRPKLNSLSPHRVRNQLDRITAVS